MIIDFNAYLGHWPFRPLQHNTASSLLRLMDRHGIDVAVVSSLSSIFYKNAHAGNQEVGQQIRRHRDRLVPFAVINPTYADWEEDLRVCVEEFGVKGLRLYPDYHGYDFGDARCSELIAAAADRGLVLAVPMRVTDSRQSHWLFRVPEIPVTRAVKAVQSYTAARFAFLNGARFTGSPLGRRDNGLGRNYYIEISRLSAVMQAEIRQLMDDLGPNRLLFGTGMPMKSPGPALVKMEALKATKREKERVLWRNANVLLGGLS